MVCFSHKDRLVNCYPNQGIGVNSLIKVAKLFDGCMVGLQMHEQSNFCAKYHHGEYSPEVISNWVRIFSARCKFKVIMVASLFERSKLCCSIVDKL